MGRKVDDAMEKLIKALYVLMIAIVVFLGGLLIAQGTADSIPKNNYDLIEGSTL